MCNLPFKKLSSICCDLCDNWIHLKCSGLKRLQFGELSSSDKTWYGKNCFSDIFPFHKINNQKLITTMQPSTNRSKSLILFKQTLDNTCSACNKKVRQQTKGLPCLGGNHIIHKKCSKLTRIDLKEIHSSMRYWECITCKKNKFPFSSIEDDELTKFSF